MTRETDITVNHNLQRHYEVPKSYSQVIGMRSAANDCKQLMQCKSVVLIRLLLVMNNTITYFTHSYFLVTEPSHLGPLLVERKVQRTNRSANVSWPMFNT